MVFMSSARREGSCSSSWHRLWKRSRKSWRRARGSSTSSRAKRAGGGEKKVGLGETSAPHPSLARRERGNEASKGLRMVFLKRKAGQPLIPSQGPVLVLGSTEMFWFRPPR